MLCILVNTWLEVYHVDNKQQFVDEKRGWDNDAQSTAKEFQRVTSFHEEIASVKLCSKK